IGTGGHGHTYPGATVPIGMVQVGPDNGRTGWDWSTGYHWSDSVLTGFSHTHLSGTGIGDLLDVLVMPVTGAVDLSSERGPDGMRPYADRLDHAQESASPGYYAVTLQRSGIAVELTATPRVGFHRIRYPEGVERGLVVDLGFAENWDAPTHVELIQVADTLFLGRRYSKGWAADQRVHFALATSRPVRALTWAGQDPYVRAHLAFGPSDGEPLLVKVALSYVDESGALSNLEAEAPGWDFDGVRARAAFRWEAELSKVSVSGGTEEDRAIFYTALYRTRMAPVLFQDVDGRYRGADGRIHEARDFTNHSIFSLWDTFRAAHPLNTILDPERVHDLVASMVAFRREPGLLPVWSHVGNETTTITGTPAVPVVVDAVLKGLTRVPEREALAAVLASQSSDLRDLDDYRAHGWIPSELGVESVTKTLEYAYDDAAVARLAERVGAAATAREFRQRAQAWQHVYDPATGFMRGRRADGSWVEPFDPLFADHRQNTDYTEGNAWQHSWFVPLDAVALVQAMCGEEAFVRRLDELFEQDTVVRGEH
ncbi:MAG: glycoside hydrolase family 92 protein, partial [Gemmatimonadetes bacterium]|nr:glycoside hydrolase family 92 protein [Gemmatimonadota bacterium]